MWVHHAYMTPSKTPQHQVSRELCWLAILHTCCHTLLLGPWRAIPCDSPGRGHWKLMLGFSWTLPYVPYSFADFNLHPFTVWTVTKVQQLFWVLWVLLEHRQTWRWSWGPLTPHGIQTGVSNLRHPGISNKGLGHIQLGAPLTWRLFENINYLIN